MTAPDLTAACLAKRSFLCLGLDTDPELIPEHLSRDAAGMLAFNKAILQACAPYVVAVKINTAFYEALGAQGWQVLEDTIKAVPPGLFIIADAKRGDIGNTASQYAKAFFERLGVQALTVSPYMGADTLEAYLRYPNAHVFALACTSNPGFEDFENQRLANGRLLYEQVVYRLEQMGAQGRLHYVAGATQPSALAAIRALAPQAWLLVPGVGAQGGDLAATCAAGLTGQVGMLVNASRSIIYAGGRGAGVQDFAIKVAGAAQALAREMDVILTERGVA